MSTTARTASGDLALPRVIVTDLARVVRQTIIDGLDLWLGEWFLDQGNPAVPPVAGGPGFPWLQKILGIKTPQPARLAQLVTDFILTVQGVAAVTANATYNGGKRAFDYTFSANLDDGTILTRTNAGDINVAGGP